MEIVQKLSDLTYPGFPDIRNYIESCGIPDYWDGENRIGIDQYHIWFDDSGKVDYDYSGFGGRTTYDYDSEMTKVLNTAEFRFFHNLLPAGTDVLTAFCQLMILKYRNKLGLSGYSGTYRVIFNVWTDISTNKNEAQLSQQVMFSYSVSSGSKRDIPLLICL
ncbi:hypothetical protein ACE1B6_12610 [Aerosakkonemataceae cyanobacterium BLCC-F154]|uniref:Uncharacterized protein n=1 Tax=Floridaenema fluviatile BLCC-F154 TaxID=3153640 RepID=A0ABV4YB92_9CYAN